MSDWQIRILSGRHCGECIPFGLEEVLVGGSEHADFRLEDQAAADSYFVLKGREQGAHIVEHEGPFVLCSGNSIENQRLIGDLEHFALAGIVFKLEHHNVQAARVRHDDRVRQHALHSETNPKRSEHKSILPSNTDHLIHGVDPKEVDEGTRVLRILELMSNRMNAQDDVRTICQSVLESWIEVTGAEHAFLLLSDHPDGAHDYQDIFAHTNVIESTDSTGANSKLSALASDTVVSHVLSSGQTLFIDQIAHHERFAEADSVLALKLSSVLCVALKVDQKVIGVLYTGNKGLRDAISAHWLVQAETLASFVALIIAQARNLGQLNDENRLLKEAQNSNRYGAMLGASSSMQIVYDRIERVAKTGVSVLIHGETGTGKELVAREIHQRSDRNKGQLVILNCGAIPENLLESELFGHVKGAFTDAAEDRVGHLVHADGGTLFLDEIGEMPLSVQVKLLRVLQERVVTPVGANEGQKVDIRVVGATHRDLKQMVDEGTFREDLFYRLNVITIEVPPLRERGKDVHLITRFLMQHFERDLGLPQKRISKEALSALLEYSFPGNVRELENRLKRAMILGVGDDIGLDDLALPEEQKEVQSLADATDAFKRQHILTTLDRFGGNRTQAARSLEIDPRTIYRYLDGEKST